MAKLVSKTYGEALFDAAVEDSCVDKLLEDAVFVMEAREEKAKFVS